MKMVAVSFGGGVQSTALAWLALSGDDRLPCVPPLWIFADTGDEPRREVGST